jgi:hypothetical protein
VPDHTHHLSTQERAIGIGHSQQAYQRHAPEDKYDANVLTMMAGRLASSIGKFSFVSITGNANSAWKRSCWWTRDATTPSVSGGNVLHRPKTVEVRGRICSWSTSTAFPWKRWPSLPLPSDACWRRTVTSPSARRLETLELSERPSPSAMRTPSSSRNLLTAGK